MVHGPATAERSRYFRRRAVRAGGLLFALAAVIVVILAWRRAQPVQRETAAPGAAHAVVTRPEPTARRTSPEAQAPTPLSTVSSSTTARNGATPAVDRENLLVALIADAAAESSADAHEKIMQDIDDLLAKADAGKVLRSLPLDAFDSLYGTKVLRRWVQQDRAAAAEWLAQAPRTDMAHAVALMDGWFAADRQNMAAYIDRLGPGHWKQEVLKAATWEAIEAGALPEATAWAKQLNSDDDRDGQLLPALQQLSAAEAKKTPTPNAPRSSAPSP